MRRISTSRRASVAKEHALWMARAAIPISEQDGPLLHGAPKWGLMMPVVDQVPVSWSQATA